MRAVDRCRSGLVSDRLPSGTRLGPVELQITRAARSVEYYQRTLGLRVLRDEGGRITLGAHGDDAPLVVLVERADARPVRPQSVLGLYHFAVLLPDRPALGRFLRHLATIGGRVGMADHAVSEAVYLTDPDGLGIEVYADRPRSSWRHDSTGQRYMTSDPLDVENVMQSAAGESWTGAPTGTQIGHVHLHVGDLARAAEFYDNAVGLDRTVWTYPGALFLAAGGYHHHLGTNTWASGPPAADDQARLLMWNIVVPARVDVDAAAARIAKVASVTRESDDSVTARDPWGTALRVTATVPA